MAEPHSGFRSLGVVQYKGTAVMANDDATPTVGSGNVFLTPTGNSGTLDILNFDGSQSGQVIHILSSNPATGPTRIGPAAREYFNILGTWSDATAQTLSLISVGSQWYELGRGSY